MSATRPVGLTMALLLMAAGAVWAQEKGSCVDCHKGLPAGDAVGHNFGDWERSVHASAGIACEACHGGNAAAKDKGGAHAGMLKASDPKSRVYFTKSPETCGSCHEAEYKAFQASAHYKELQKSGKGPNCVTCHGSMANVVLGPKELETTCVLCHREPTQAFNARLELDSAGSMVRGVSAAIKRARDAGAADLAAEEKSYAEIVGLQQATVIQWHTFNLREVVTSAKEVKRRVTALLAQLKVKTPSAAKTKKP